MSKKNTLPKEWVLGELIDFCIKSKRAIVDGPFGSNLKTEHFKKQGVPVINSSFVTELTFNAKEYVYVDDELFQREIRSKVVPGDIVMAKIGARCGSSAILPENHPISILSGNSLKISIDENENSKEFVWHLLINEYFKNQFKDCKSVGAQPAISTPHLKKLKFPKPPLTEQKAIAQVLSTADAAIHTTEKLIAQKELRKKWLMQQLLTGKKRLKGFEGEWKFVRFKEIYSQVKQKAGDEKFLVLSVTKDGIVSQAEYFNKEIASEDTSPYLVVRKGDMAMSGLNFWMGSIDVLVEYEIGMVSPAYKVFEIYNPEISATFMKSFVRSEIMLQCLIGSSVVGASIVRRNLDRETLNEWSFRLPLLEEQTAIAQVLQAADKEISLLKAKADKLREQKKGLMQVLLTGKVRLKI